MLVVPTQQKTTEYQFHANNRMIKVTKVTKNTRITMTSDCERHFKNCVCFSTTAGMQSSLQFRMSCSKRASVIEQDRGFQINVIPKKVFTRRCILIFCLSPQKNWTVAWCIEYKWDVKVAAKIQLKEPL